MGSRRGDMIGVRRVVLAGSSTCRLCQGLLRDAHAFTECLHTCLTAIFKLSGISCFRLRGQKLMLPRFQLLHRKRTKATRTPASCATPLSNNGTMKILITEETGKISAPKSTKMTTTVNNKQINSDIVASSHPSPEDRKNGKTMDMEELWKPLSSYLEASETKSLRSNLKSHAAAAKDKIETLMTSSQ